jgi:glycosyltransferase involved in cell wall biosynthesis
MASGLPVLISSTCGCATDLVYDGRNGFAFNPHDMEQLALLMVKISSPDADLAALGQASRTIIKNWNLERFASSLKKAIECAQTLPTPPPEILDEVLLWALARR